MENGESAGIGWTGGERKGQSGLWTPSHSISPIQNLYIKNKRNIAHKKWMKATYLEYNWMKKKT